MNNQTEIIKPGAVSNDAGTATNVASTEPVPAVANKPKTATDQGDAGNAQTTNTSDVEKQVKSDVPTSVKLELSEEEADMIQTLLNDYVLAYRSDRSVDYKPELVPREKVGHYPYVATPPAPEIINPAYDWINKKWYSKNTSDSLPDLANTVTDLKAKNKQLNQDIESVKGAQIINAQQAFALTQAIQKMTESQNKSEKLMTSTQEILVGIKATQDQKKATPIESQTNQTQSVQDKNENGGN